MPGLGKVRKYKDLDLSFGIHPIRKDISILEDDQAVKQSIKNLVLINHFERPFHPELGSNVPELLFDNAGPMTAAAVRRSVADVIENFEERVELIDVEVQDNIDSNRYHITVTFFINNLEEPVSVDFFLKRLR